MQRIQTLKVCRLDCIEVRKAFELISGEFKNLKRLVIFDIYLTPEEASRDLFEPLSKLPQLKELRMCLRIWTEVMYLSLNATTSLI